MADNEGAVDQVTEQCEAPQESEQILENKEESTEEPVVPVEQIEEANPDVANEDVPVEAPGQESEPEIKQDVAQEVKEELEPENGDMEQPGEEKPTENPEKDETEEKKELQEGGLINATEDNDAKMFIGGLSWDTQTCTLREYFEKYGEVEDCTIKKDSKTEKSRGFGFVLFKDPASVEEVLKVKETKEHWLDGRRIDPKRAEAQRKDGKMFVGGISPDSTDEAIKEHFSRFGEIESFERPSDKVTGKKRGFCFITFRKDGILKLACAEHSQELDGKKIDVKEAQQQLERGSRGPFMGRSGGMGMGRGSWGGPPVGYGSGGYGYGGYGGNYDNYGYGGGGGYGQGGGYGNNFGGYPGGYGGGKGSKGREGMARRRGGGWEGTRTHSSHINWHGHRGQFHGAYHGYHDY